MGSTNNASFATSGKHSHRSHRTLDSGLDSFNCGIRESKRCCSAPLNPILSSGDRYQSNNSKSRHKRNVNKDQKLYPRNENSSESSREW